MSRSESKLTLFPSRDVSRRVTFASQPSLAKKSANEDDEQDFLAPSSATLGFKEMWVVSIPMIVVGLVSSFSSVFCSNLCWLYLQILGWVRL